MNTSTVCLRIVKSLFIAHWKSVVKSVVVGLTLLMGGFASDAARAQDVNLGEFSASNGFVLTGSVPGSSAAGTLMHAGDFNGDGFADLVVGSPLSSGNSYTYLYFGGPTESGTFNLTSVKNAPSARAISFRDVQYNIGFYVDTAGDFNGDGFEDVLLVSPTRAVAYIVFGGSDPHLNRDLTTINASTSWAVKFTYHPHMRLPEGRGIGDINNDGYDDVFLSTNKAVGGFAYNNSWVIFGGPDRKGVVDLTNFQTSDDNGFMILNQTFSGIVPVGDFNGDGFADFMLSRALGGIVVLGKEAGFEDITHWPWSLENCVEIRTTLYASHRLFPSGSLGITSDFNGDGKSDIIWGGFSSAPDQAGNVYVVYGSDELTTITLEDLPADPSLGFAVNGAPNDQIGKSCTFIGDINGDGYADISIDSPFYPYGNTETGSSYVIYGRDDMPGVLNLEADFVSGTTGFRVRSAGENDARLYYSAAAGDVNNDGLDDMLFLSSEYDPVVGDTVGFSYVLYGRADAGVSDWQLWEP